MEEIWKDIQGYDGLYQISNYGRFKRCNKTVRYNGKSYKLFEKILYQGVGTSGYLTVHLYGNGKRKTVQAHRLVAKAFIDNPLNKKYVNHKNGVKTNNHIENLEWVTPKENCDHAFQHGITTVSRKITSERMKQKSGDKNHKSKSILNTLTLRRYQSITECANDIGINRQTLSYKLRNNQIENLILKQF